MHLFLYAVSRAHVIPRYHQNAERLRVKTSNVVILLRRLFLYNVYTNSVQFRRSQLTLCWDCEVRAIEMRLLKGQGQVLFCKWLVIMCRADCFR